MEHRFTFTDRSDGDLSVRQPGEVLDQRRSRIAPGPWTWLDQAHGDHVVVVRAPGEHAGVSADGAVTDAPGAVLSVVAADCAPLVLLAEGAIGVVHAGWRGLRADVVDRAVEQLAAMGHRLSGAVLGPTVAAHHYEFGPSLLDEMCDLFGPSVRGATYSGAPAFDLPEAVRIVVGRHGVELSDIGVCTACSPDHWSHRQRGDTCRHSAVAWLG